MNNALLPPNATQFEKDLAESAAGISNIDLTDISNLYNPDLCPADLLRWLAYSLQVDYWNVDWTETIKRAYLKQHLESRRIRGTAGSLKKALAALNMDITVIEWWQADPPTAPGTFTVEVDLLDEGIGADTQAEIDRIITLHKNVRSQLTVINVYQPVAGDAYAGGVLQDSEEITIYPQGWPL